MFQEVTVHLSTAALQSVGMADGGCQSVQAHGFGVRVRHVDKGEAKRSAKIGYEE